MFEEVQNNEEVDIDESEHEGLYAEENGNSQNNQFEGADGSQQIQEGANTLNGTNGTGNVNKAVS